MCEKMCVQDCKGVPRAATDFNNKNCKFECPSEELNYAAIKKNKATLFIVLQQSPR